jgi:hypothetical protein
VVEATAGSYTGRQATRETPTVAVKAPTGDPRGSDRAVRGGGEVRSTVEAG